MGKPERLTGMADTLKNPSYSTSIGLLRMGLDFEAAFYEDDSSTSLPGTGRIGNMLGNFLRRLLPDTDND
jgi:hypothetical protein